MHCLLRLLSPLFSAAAVALLGAPDASASPLNAVLTFENLSSGVQLSNQYAALGAVFSPNGFSGVSDTGSNAGTWASNTDLTIVSSSTGGDIGDLGEPNLVNGNVVRSYSGWSAEDGDASFKIQFSVPVKFFSIDFAGVADSKNVRLFITEADASQSVVSTELATGQFSLSYAAHDSIASIVVTPGSYDDWVAFDNVIFGQSIPTAVPEPSALLLFLAGSGVLILRRSRSNSKVSR